MSCNTCDQINKNVSTTYNPMVKDSCIRTLDSHCVIYFGTTLAGFNGLSGDRLDSIISKIATALKTA